MSYRRSTSTRAGLVSPDKSLVPCQYCEDWYSKRGIGEHERHCRSRTFPWSLLNWSFKDVFGGFLWVLGSLKSLFTLCLLLTTFAWVVGWGGVVWWIATNTADIGPQLFSMLFDLISKLHEDLAVRPADKVMNDAVEAMGLSVGQYACAYKDWTDGAVWAWKIQGGGPTCVKKLAAEAVTADD